MSRWYTLQVGQFSISDENEGYHQADNPNNFEDTVTLLEKLRAEQPGVSFTIFAEIDA